MSILKKTQQRTQIKDAAARYNELTRQKKELEKELKETKKHILELLPEPNNYRIGNYLVKWQRRTTKRIDPKLVKELVSEPVIEACTKESTSDYLTIEITKGV